MSWSVSASGPVAEVQESLQKQFSYPLDEKSGLPDPGERETVRRVAETIYQCLGTFGREKVTVSAFGHMGYANYDTKAGGYQEVSVSIK